MVGVVNHAFGNHDRTSELEWMEDRMVFVMRAENLFRWIPCTCSDYISIRS